jgi:hypothetical protein
MLATVLFTYLAWRHLRTIASYDELQELMLGSTAAAENGDELFFEEPVHPGETVQNRVIYLDEQLTKADQTKDTDRYSEAAARLNLISVRQGEVKGVRSNESLTKIHNAFRAEMEKNYPTFPWNLDRMYRGTLAEGRRLKELLRLQAQGPLTPVPNK